MVDAIRQIGVSEVTYYRWRQEFGWLKSEQVKRLKDLELDNSRHWTSSFCRRPPGETSKPRASPCLHRAGASAAARLRASRLCGARAASLDATQDPVRREDEERLTADIIELAR